MSNPDHHIADQITCHSIQLSGPIQGKKIEIQVDVKPVKEEKKPKPEKNFDWEILGFLVLILFFLIGIVGNSTGLDYSPNHPPHPNSSDSHLQNPSF